MSADIKKQDQNTREVKNNADLIAQYKTCAHFQRKQISQGASRYMDEIWPLIVQLLDKFMSDQISAEFISSGQLARAQLADNANSNTKRQGRLCLPPEPVQQQYEAAGMALSSSRTRTDASSRTVVIICA